MGEEKPKMARPPWRGMVFLVAGLLLAIGASILAQRTGLGRSLTLDFKGLRTIGTAEPQGGDIYLIRYEHPGGTIFRRQYTGRLSGEELPGGTLEIAVVFNPEQPSEFQPAGLSYFPGVIAVTMFIAGMWSVLKARTVMRRHYLKAAGREEEKTKKKSSSKKPTPAQQRRKMMRFVLSIVIALLVLLMIYGCPQLNIPALWDDSVVVERQ